MKPTGPVSLYCFSQDVSLGLKFDSLGADGCHGLYASSLSFGPKIIPEAIFNNQGKDEYRMRKGRLSRSGYLLMEIRVCPMGMNRLS